jgi:hypothetical protein
MCTCFDSLRSPRYTWAVEPASSTLWGAHAKRLAPDTPVLCSAHPVRSLPSPAPAAVADEGDRAQAFPQHPPPAGHGKTLLLSEGPTRCGQTGPQVRAAWLALDDGHCDPSPPILVRDRDRIIEPQPVGETLTFVLEYLPSHAVLITSTCRDPTLPLSPVRAVSTALMAAGAAPSTVWLRRSAISTRPQSRRSHPRPH